MKRLSIQLNNTVNSLLSAEAVGMKNWFILITEICLQLLVCFPLCSTTVCYCGIMSNKHILFFGPSIPSPPHPLAGLGPEPRKSLWSCKGTHLVHSAPVLLFPEQEVSAQELKFLISVHLQDTKRKSTNSTCSTNHHTLQTTHCNYVINRIC